MSGDIQGIHWTLNFKMGNPHLNGKIRTRLRQSFGFSPNHSTKVAMLLKSLEAGYIIPQYDVVVFADELFETVSTDGDKKSL